VRLALPLAALLLGCSQSPEAHAPETKRARASEIAFVHLFEWRWNDIAKECETYLGPAGFSAVQISPPNEHAILPGQPWWQRYQEVGYGLERSRSGTLEEFRGMVSRCAAVGVDIYVDAVINHMTAQASGTGSNGTTYTKYEYPGLFGADDFHAPPCMIDGSDYADAPERVRSCELLGLADLDTAKESVRERIAEHLADFVELGVRGFRIDAAKHMATDDLQAIVDKVDARTGPAAAPYYFFEVIDYGKEAIRAADYLGVGASRTPAIDVTEFKFTGIGEKFLNTGGQRLAELRSLDEASWNLLPSERALVFLTNHDTQRASGIYYADGAYLDLATVFLLAWPYGYPSILSSYAFDRASAAGRDSGPPADASGNTLPLYAPGSDAPSCATAPSSAAPGTWLCEHRQPRVAAMVGFRRATVDAKAVTHFWDDGGNQIAFGRGDRGFVVINRSDVDLSRAFDTDLPAGRYCDVLQGPVQGGACAGSAISVAPGGSAEISVPASSAAAIHVEARTD
jgi:alpha-amylase